MLSATIFLITVSIMHQAWALPPTTKAPLVQGHVHFEHPAFFDETPPISGCQSRGVGFSARKAAGGNQWFHINAPTKIKFQETLSSFGAHSWDNSKFCCTHFPGHYFFSFHAESSENGDFTLALLKNGKYQVTGYGSKNGYQWAGNSAMIYLNNNDCVWLELQQGTIYEHPHGDEGYTTFTGFLVAP